jgi:hypothetical protein
MFWSNRINTLAGIVLLALPIFLVVAIVLNGVSTGDNDPMEKGEVEEFLLEVHDNRDLAIASAGAFVVVDVVVGALVATVLYLLFRDRSNVLALLTFVAFVLNGALSGVVDGIDAGIIVLADDYVDGGAGLEPGDPAILEIARALSVTSGMVGMVSFTALGLALASLGLLLVMAPEGAVNPPRFFGWVSLIGGVAAFASWLVLLSDAGFIAFAIQGIAGLILFIGLGIWLLRHSSDAVPVVPATAPKSA